MGAPLNMVPKNDILKRSNNLSVGGHGVGPCTSFLSGKRSTDELAALRLACARSGQAQTVFHVLYQIWRTDSMIAQLILYNR